MKVYTEQELKELGMKELVSIYNSFPGIKPIKKLGTLATGVVRVLKAQGFAVSKSNKEQESRSVRATTLINQYHKLTNGEFSKTKKFINLCSKAGAKPTIRQASKFRNCRGLAYKSA